MIGPQEQELRAYRLCLLSRKIKGEAVKFILITKLKKSSFTVLELVISLSILAVVAGSIFAVLNVGDMTWRREMAMVGLQQDVRLAIDGMARELRASNSSSITITGGSRIDFSIPSPSDPTSSVAIAYYLSGDQIIREHPVGTTKVLAENITALVFSLSGDVVAVDVGASDTARGGIVNFDLTEQVRLRND